MLHFAFKLQPNDVCVAADGGGGEGLAEFEDEAYQQFGLAFPQPAGWGCELVTRQHLATFLHVPRLRRVLQPTAHLRLILYAFQCRNSGGIHLPLWPTPHDPVHHTRIPLAGDVVYLNLPLVGAQLGVGII